MVIRSTELIKELKVFIYSSENASTTPRHSLCYPPKNIVCLPYTINILSSNKTTIIYNL